MADNRFFVTAPGGGENVKPYQQLVTGADGKAKWEDRLAYKDTVEKVILPEMTGVVTKDDENEQAQLGNITAENLNGLPAVGDVLQVKWNDEMYECTVMQGDRSGDYQIGVMWGEFTNGDYPFWIYGRKDGSSFTIYADYATTAAGTEIVVSMTKNENIVKMIPAECLPIVIFDLVKKTCNVDFDTAVKVIQNGGIISIIDGHPETDDPRYAENYTYPIYIEADPLSHLYNIYSLNQSGNVGYFSYTESGQILVAE